MQSITPYISHNVSLTSSAYGRDKKILFLQYHKHHCVDTTRRLLNVEVWRMTNVRKRKVKRFIAVQSIGHGCFVVDRGSVVRRTNRYISLSLTVKTMYPASRHASKEQVRQTWCVRLTSAGTYASSSYDTWAQILSPACTHWCTWTTVSLTKKSRNYNVRRQFYWQQGAPWTYILTSKNWFNCLK